MSDVGKVIAAFNNAIGMWVRGVFEDGSCHDLLCVLKTWGGGTGRPGNGANARSGLIPTGNPLPYKIKKKRSDKTWPGTKHFMKKILCNLLSPVNGKVIFNRTPSLIGLKGWDIAACYLPKKTLTSPRISQSRLSFRGIREMS